MSVERIALAVATVLCLSLAAWNIHLQSQLTEVRTDLAEKNDAPVNPDAESENPAARAPRAARSQWEERSAETVAAQPGAPGGDAPESTGTDEASVASTPDWDAVRVEMETATVDVIEGYGAQSGWDRELTDEVLAIYLDTGEAISDVWNRMHDGETTHYQARKEMREIRDGTTEELIGLIGESAHEAVEEHLWEARREVWRRTPGRSERSH